MDFTIGRHYFEGGALLRMFESATAKELKNLTKATRKQLEAAYQASESKSHSKQGGCALVLVALLGLGLLGLAAC